MMMNFSGGQSGIDVGGCVVVSASMPFGGGAAEYVAGACGDLSTNPRLVIDKKHLTAAFNEVNRIPKMLPSANVSSGEVSAQHVSSGQSNKPNGHTV